MGNDSFTIDKTARVTHCFNVDREFVKLAVITLKASLPRLIASMATTEEKGAKVTVKGVIKDGVFGVLFIVNAATLVYAIPFRDGFVVSAMVTILYKIVL